MNEAVPTMLTDVKLHGWQILHLAGRDHAEAVRDGLPRPGVPAARDRLHARDGGRLGGGGPASAAPGASSCAELTACGVPSVLMPYPYHKDMHQRLNAKVLADAGAAVLIDDEKDRRKNADKLRPAVESLLYDAERRKTMAAAARKLGKPDAAGSAGGHE